MIPYQNTQYPVYALGSNMASAVLQHCSNTKVPPEMVGPVALSCAASAVQNLVNIARPGLAPSPVSLNVLLVAGSGEGKDLAAGPFIKPLQEFQQSASEAAAEVVKRMQVDEASWRVKQDVLLGELKNCIREGVSEAAITARIGDHLAARPKSPRSPKIIFDDATSTAVKMSLCTNWPSALVYSMEGTSVFNGRLMADFGFWNSVWGGSPVVVDRVGETAISVAAPRLSMLQGIQAEPLARFLRRRGAEASDSGLLARFLVACPPSTKGFRPIDDGIKPTDRLDAYAHRCTELLHESAKLSKGVDDERQPLVFTDDAQRHFIQIYNALQDMMRPYGVFQDMAAHAAKQAEYVARVAGILHMWDGSVGPILEETLRRAAIIVQWHAFEYMKLFSSATAPARDAQDAQELETLLVKRRFLGHPTILRKDLVFVCPDSWKRARTERALHVLVNQGRVRIEARDRTSVVRLADSLMPFPGTGVRLTVQLGAPINPGSV